MSTQLRIKRLFSLAFGSLAMLAVALLSAFITMRLAIHGREVDVPAFQGLPIADAQRRAASKGLGLTVENRFYSTVIPAGRVLSQLPAPGVTVRRDSQVRIAESLGSQRVSIPDVVGQSERSATITLRRLSLDLGTVSHIPSTGAPDTILAQTPPPNSENIDGPRVSLLVSEPIDPHGDAHASVGQTAAAIVMPILTGVSPATAAARAAAAGLHILADPGPATAAIDPTNPDPANLSPESLTATLPGPTGNVIGQYPAAGHRVSPGQGVRLTYAHPSAPVDPDATIVH